MKIQARVSGRVAAVTAVMLLLTCVTEYAHDKTHPGMSSTAEQAMTDRPFVATPDAREMAAEEVSETPLRGGKISLMIFRIN
ncbi:MAG: hypothetical protein EXR85_01690 [Xanthomonadales bacterium]|nr:hypothetical protein [Xanthomonadales bacterium]